MNYIGEINNRGASAGCRRFKDFRKDSVFYL